MINFAWNLTNIGCVFQLILPEIWLIFLKILNSEVCTLIAKTPNVHGIDFWSLSLTHTDHHKVERYIEGQNAILTKKWPQLIFFSAKRSNSLTNQSVLRNCFRIPTQIKKFRVTARFTTNVTPFRGIANYFISHSGLFCRFTAHYSFEFGYLFC